MAILWSLNRENTIIAQKLPDPLSKKAGSGNETKSVLTSTLYTLTGQGGGGRQHMNILAHMHTPYMHQSWKFTLIIVFMIHECQHKYTSSHAYSLYAPIVGILLMIHEYYYYHY